jgi:hypothetical protein
MGSYQKRAEETEGTYNKQQQICVRKPCDTFAANDRLSGLSGRLRHPPADGNFAAFYILLTL